jgi:LDH2 family malate/lactate/ureidoglycolate dehydrogenase
VPMTGIGLVAGRRMAHRAIMGRYSNRAALIA